MTYLAIVLAVLTLSVLGLSFVVLAQRAIIAEQDRRIAAYMAALQARREKQ